MTKGIENIPQNNTGMKIEIPENLKDFSVEYGEELKDNETPLQDLKMVENAIKVVEDPDVGVDVFNLGLIYDHRLDKKGNVIVDMTLTSPTCPYGEQLINAVAISISDLEGVGKVTVNLIWEPQWTMERLSDEARFDLDLL
ncbi:MAG: metal-sulfur cluster assembly factor [Alphaproteobacteria bacterium]|jgi:metal-sulfur cluster biosynthetic enzyme|nr:metal-sulfur cluster assembly factor [Alphaproteobacteria bacterium]